LDTVLHPLGSMALLVIDGVVEMIAVLTQLLSDIHGLVGMA